jgi:hypothetical protein
LAALILALCRQRGAGRSLCPSEVARAAAGAEGDWRGLMPAVRTAAIQLAEQGAITISQRGRPVAPDRIRGPIRLGLPPDPA